MNKNLMVVVAIGFARNLTIEIQTTEFFMNTSIFYTIPLHFECNTKLFYKKKKQSVICTITNECSRQDVMLHTKFIVYMISKFNL